MDEGKLTEDEVAAHPQRSLLVKALGGAQPDVRLRDVQAGDRYLLCSDGVHTVLDSGTLHRVLAADEPEQAVQRLVALTNDAGGPDNIGCVVAHLTDRAGHSSSPTQSSSP